MRLEGPMTKIDGGRNSPSKASRYTLGRDEETRKQRRVGNDAACLSDSFNFSSPSTSVTRGAHEDTHSVYRRDRSFNSYRTEVMVRDNFKGINHLYIGYSLREDG